MTRYSCVLKNDAVHLCAGEGGEFRASLVIAAVLMWAGAFSFAYLAPLRSYTTARHAPLKLHHTPDVLSCSLAIMMCLILAGLILSAV